MIPAKKWLISCVTSVLLLFTCQSLYASAPPAGERFVFYLASNGHLHVLWAPNGGSWTDLDMYAESSFCPVAAAGSALPSIVDNVGVVHVYYETTTNQICEYGINGISSAGFTGYNKMPTSGFTQPETGSAITAFVDPTSGTNDIVHVFYEGTNGNVYEMFYNGSGAINTVYSYDDPTSLAGGAPIAEFDSPLTSFDDGGVMHVFYLGTNDNIYELYWTGGSTWHQDDPTSLAGGAPLPASGSPLRSFVDISGNMHVFYVNSQNVREVYWTGGSTWHTDDPTTLAGAPVTVTGSALTSFDNASGLGDTGGHVMYLGTNEHVEALNLTPGVWHYFDATSASGGVAAASGSKLASFQDTETGGVRFYFTGTNNHVYELYWATEGTASETDVTAASGSSTTAASGSALSGGMEPR